MTLDDMTTKAATPPPADLLTVGSVPIEFERSTRWAFRRIQAGMLTRYRIDGDLATYVSRAEVAALLAPVADA